MPRYITRHREIIRVTHLGICLKVIVNEKPLNLEKTTSSVLSVLLLICNLYDLQAALKRRDQTLAEVLRTKDKLEKQQKLERTGQVQGFQFFRMNIGPNDILLKTF